jgi:anthranilate phosphoribosyltransferase
MKPSGHLTSALQTLLQGRSLSVDESSAAMNEIMSGSAAPAQIAAFLTALKVKGETSDEIAGAALAMRRAMVRVKSGHSVVADTCGTGGDGKNGFNVSTAAAFVAAGAGLPVAKHGNRSVSSRCGSADVLEALGINPEIAPAKAHQALKKIGIAFFFAPKYHPAMRHAMPVRRELGFRTIFNLLGPLSSPAGAHVQLVGVPEKELVETIAQTLAKLGEKHGLVIHTEGWDEVTLTGASIAFRVIGNSLQRLYLTPGDFGLAPVREKDLSGGTARQNAGIILRVLQGQNSPQRRVVVANAACLLWIAGGAGNRQKLSIKEAVRLAEHSIDSGSALEKLNALRQISPKK